ncbi:MAG: fimbria major subunit [Muribaculaceae bacterium]|nr:fimbria major subunit [Muribaculaceae bacterium]
MKKIYGLAMAAALFGLASCSSDDAPEVKNPDVIDGPVVGYVKMNLPAGTRAADGKTYIHFTKNGADVKCEPAKDSDGNPVTGVYALSAIPDKVVVFQDADLTTTGTTENKDAKVPAVMIDGTYGSVVPETAIFHNIADHTTATAIDVYLDRTVAETTVALGENYTNDMSENKFDGYTITFIPTHVFVNGVAKYTDIIKSLPTLGEGSTTIQGASVANTLLSYYTAEGPGKGKGTTWANTDYDWKDTNEIEHYQLTDGLKATSQTSLIFERAPQTASDLTKDFTHVIVAGYYQLTKVGETTPLDAQTFYVYSANADGQGIVYFNEDDVKEAMGASSLSLAKTTQNGMNTHLVGDNGETCVKYDNGYVYYAAPINHFTVKVGEDTKYVKGIVRNHKYSITINTIKGWGTAIPNLDEPIIPEDPKNPEQNFIKLNVVVNDWQPVEDQGVEWK